MAQVIHGKVRLIALSKPNYVTESESWTARGFTLVPYSLNVRGYVYTWEMQEPEGGERAAAPESVSDEPTPPLPVTATFSSEPVEAPVGLSKDFLPDWDKVDSFLKDNSERDAKKLLDVYAEGFDIKLNRRSNFAKMKAEFIKQCSQ